MTSWGVGKWSGSHVILKMWLTCDFEVQIYCTLVLNMLIPCYWYYAFIYSATTFNSWLHDAQCKIMHAMWSNLNHHNAKHHMPHHLFTRKV